MVQFLNGSQLILFLLIWLLGFALVSAFWSFLFFIGALSDSITNNRLIFFLFDLIIGFIFNYLLRDALKSYTSGPTLYRTLLNRITEISKSINSYFVLKGTAILKQEIIITMISTDQEETVTVKRILNDIKYLLIFMIETTYIIFVPEYRVSTKVITKIVEVMNLGILLDQPPIEAIQNATYIIQRKIDILKKEKVIEPSDVILLAPKFDKLIDLLRDIDISIHVKNQPILQKWLIVTIIVYFSLVPITYVKIFGFFTIIIYSLILLLIFGVLIIRYWLNDPFKRQPSWSPIMDFFGWMRNKIEIIKKGFKQIIEIE